MVRDFVTRVFNGAGQPWWSTCSPTIILAGRPARDHPMMGKGKAMTGAMWLRNLVAFAVQAGVLVLAGRCSNTLPDTGAAGVAGTWRTLLAVCLLLPLCQPWQSVTAPSTEVVTAAPVADASIENVTQARVPSTERAVISLERVVLVVLAGGLAARGAWLVLGAWMLGRIRREATPLDPLPEAITRAQERVGVSAAMCVSTRVAGPLTFGLLRPVVVFPPGVTAMEESVQHAIACHELLHVRRRDWVFQVIEESVRTIFWFHPAIWWLVGHIQLTREQVVDQAAVRLMIARALRRSVAGRGDREVPGHFTPAPAFLRRSLRKKRVAQILQESTMTTRRLIRRWVPARVRWFSPLRLVVRSFPLEAQGQRRPPAASPSLRGHRQAASISFTASRRSTQARHPAARRGRRHARSGR
jgi:hypothetical protein